MAIELGKDSIDIGIVVRDEPRPTAARLALDSPADVHRLLAAVLGRLPGARA